MLKGNYFVLMVLLQIMSSKSVTKPALAILRVCPPTTLGVRNLVRAPHRTTMVRLARCQTTYPK